MGRCSAGAAECATTKTSTPLLSPPCAVPTIASTWRCATGRRTSPLLPCPPSRSPPVPRSLDAPRRRGPQNATRRARDHCGSPVARSPTSQPIQSKCSLGRRAITINHESIRHEVFAAAAAATAEAAQVGEQRRRIHGCNPQPDIAVRHAGATQSLVDVVIDAGARLPFTIHRHVRLDARVPACLNVAPGRLLRLDLANADRVASEKERESGTEETREGKRADRESYTLTISD